jgi:AraC-like DNA-binding protein
VIRAGDWHLVPATLERHQVDVVLIDAGLHEPLPFTRLAWLRRQHARVATLVLLDPRGRELELFRLGRLGVDDVLLDEGEANLSELPSSVDRALIRALARRAGARLRGRVPHLFVEGLVWAVEQADTRPGPDELARALTRPLDSYRRALRRARLPPPSRVLLWGRLIRAAHMLHREDLSVEVVAHRLGYASASSLARAFRRETGHPPSEIRARGGPVVVLEALLGHGGSGQRPFTSAARAAR